MCTWLFPLRDATVLNTISEKDYAKFEEIKEQNTSFNSLLLGTRLFVFVASVSVFKYTGSSFSLFGDE